MTRAGVRVCVRTVIFLALVTTADSARGVSRTYRAHKSADAPVLALFPLPSSRVHIMFGSRRAFVVLCMDVATLLVRVG